MNMQEACELAQAIEGNSLYAVIAVGRFVMTDELTAVSKLTMRWGVSVALLSDKTDRTVVFTEDEWRAYATATAIKSQPSSQPPVKPTTKCPAQLTTRHEEQLSLF